MDLDLANKNVLIIGASGGIGSAIVNTFNEEECKSISYRKKYYQAKKIKK